VRFHHTLPFMTK